MELNLDPLNFSLLQIRFLINNLNRKNHKQSAQELNQIVNRYGLEAENYVLRVLFTEAGKYAWDCDKNANSYLNNNLHATLLATRVTGLLNNPAKATVLCRLVDQPSRTLKKILKTNNTLIHQQLYVPQMDQLGALRHGMASISFGQPRPAYGMAATLGQLVAASVSPSHMVGGPPHSPFAMMPVHSMAMGVTRMASVPNMDNSLLIQDPSKQCSDSISNINKDVDDEVDSYFKCIYNHPPHPTLSIEEVLDMLKKFQDSPESRERDIFCCMLRNLFEEYKFFPQYPDKELHITAQLFGGIIERGLVPTYVSLGLALRFVLESLKKEEGSKMYFFGIAALDSFKTRLKDYHKYCEHVRAIPYFHQLPAHLREYVEYGMQSQEPPHKPNGPVLPATLAAVVATTTVSFATTTAGSSSVTTNTASCSGGSTTQYRAAAVTCQPSTSGSSMPTVGQYGSRPSIANASNINTLLIAMDKVNKITVPPEPVQIKTAVIFNNLSQINLTTKCDELKEVLTEEYYPWLSQYLVMQRVTLELNFHALYSNFLDVMKQRDLNTMVTEETYRNIKVLLRSDKAIANFSDRSLLKNLGHWLGMITISKNLPILYVQIDLKELVLEAYHKGLQELLFVVPFVGKILESCTKSKVFKPPNPWTMAIMRVLVELHQDSEMKLNLKFEVEVLCKNLGLDINDLSPAYYLRNPDQETLMRNEMLRQRNNTEQEALPGACVQLMLPPVKLEDPSPCMMNAEEMAIAEQRALQIAAQADERSMGPQKPPPDPKYTYNEVNITSNEAFATKVNYCVTLPVFDTYPHLKQFIQPSLERSIQEWIHPVVDRAIKYGLTTCERIVRKDFSLDPDEGRLRTCAHYMMRNLTAGMAMVTCKEEVHATLTTNLKSAFIEALLPSAAPPNMIDPAVTIITNENIELACAFIQKTAVEKALPELDKRLIADFDVRKLARTEGRCYYDPIILTYERLPERVRLRSGPPNQDQLMVYEEFSWNIPGFLAMRDHLFVPKHNGSDQMSYSLMMNQSHGLEDMSAISADAVQFLEQSANVAELTILALNIHSLLDCFIITRRSLDIVTGCTLLQKTVEGLIEGYMVDPEILGFKDLITLYRDVHLRTLRMLEDVRVCGQPWTIQQITYCITECREDRRYNLLAVDCLIRNHFVNLQQYDIAISNEMDDGKNFAAVSFAMQIVRLYLVDDRNNMYVNEADLTCVTDTLVRASMKTERCAPTPEGLNSLVETLRVNQDPSAHLGEKSPLGPTAFIHYGIMHARMQYHEDPPFMVENTELIIRKWQTIQRFPQTEIKLLNNFDIYLQCININGILTTEDLQTRFLTIAAQKVILEVYELINEDNVNPPQNPSNRDRIYNPADSFMRLVALLIRHTPDNGHPIPKLNLLNKMLGIIAGCLLQDHEMCRVAGTFHQLPYYRLLIILYQEIYVADPILESLNYQILTAFCHTLRIVKPSVAPGFAYGWLDFLSHRTFIDRILGFTAQQKGWGMYSTLMLDLFKFMKPCLRNNNLKPSMTTMYTGVLRVFLVLLHDFPEFLCDYCYTFCNEIALNCVQLRNVILSAFPRTMRLPDPHTPNLKVDLLPEITMPPRAVINYVAILPNTQFKKDLDVYLTTSKPVSFLSNLTENMQITNESGTVYNVQLINAVVLYVGTQGIAHIRSKGEQTTMTTIAHTTHMDVFQGFAAVLDFEGRYLFLNAIIDQLRYPNSHTHYFSCALLYLFAGANVSAIQEQITRVLLERLIVNHPHPWGLLVTFIELIQNPVYTFWKFDFVNFSPEIEKLIESVIRSCGADPTKFGESMKHAIQYNMFSGSADSQLPPIGRPMVVVPPNQAPRFPFPPPLPAAVAFPTEQKPWNRLFDKPGSFKGKSGQQ